MNGFRKSAMKALTGATLIDGTGSPPVKNATVLINGKYIKAVGPPEAVHIPADADVTDISGLTVLPGLIDTHDHLGSLGYGLLPRWKLQEPLSLQDLRIAKRLKETLEMGYTTVRDAGRLDAGFKMAVDEGLIPGPRLILALTIISPTGGMSDARSPSGHCMPEEYSSVNLPSGVCDGVEGVRAKVREMVRAGADVIKFATTAGVQHFPGYNPESISFDPDEVQALVDEAHALGRLTMCHAFAGPGLRMGIAAGADSIEHGFTLDSELVQMMADKNIFYVPTLAVFVYHRDPGANPNFQRYCKEMYPRHIESIRHALAGGVKIAAGSDAGGWGSGLNALELECLVEAGMSPMQAIQSATSVAAECIGMKDQVGRLSPGMLADVVAVEGDPLQNIRLLQGRDNFKLVIKDGVIYRSTLNPSSPN